MLRIMALFHEDAGIFQTKNKNMDGKQFYFSISFAKIMKFLTFGQLCFQSKL